MSLSDELYRRMTKVSDQTIYEDIENFEIWDRLLFQAEEGNATTRSELINRHIESRWGELASELRGAVQDTDGRLFIHRCIAVKDMDSLVDSLSRGKLIGKYKGLGIYWTLDYAKAECHWAHPDKYEKLILTGTVDLDAIDIRGTVLANFNPDLGMEESEIMVKEGAKIRLTDLSVDDTRHLKRFDPPLEFPA